MKRYNKIDSKGNHYALIKRKKTTGEVYYGKCYPKGKKQNDVIDIPVLASTAKERTDYPTQKPLALLKLIIKASSKEGDLVLDPFCGCATTCVAAEKLNRRWIGIDLSSLAGKLVKKRLYRQFNQGNLATGIINPVIRKDLPVKNAPKPSKNIRHTLYGKQQGYCKGCKVHFQFVNLTVDHITPTSKGGQDTDKNLQLLCQHCNSVKGDRDMEYLSSRLVDNNISIRDIQKVREKSKRKRKRKPIKEV